MAHQYRQRTYDEATELAQAAFKAMVKEHLTVSEIEEMAQTGRLTSGTIGSDWEVLLGCSVNPRTHYEFEIYKPKDEKPYIDKSFVRMLVPRNRSKDKVTFMWRPFNEVQPFK